METIYNSIENLYKRKGYLDEYGGSLFITFLSLLFFFILYSFLYIRTNIEPIKRNWAKEKCNPIVIPFAGFINASPNQSAFDYTSENFNGCINSILTNISNHFLQPIYYLMTIIHGITSIASESVQMIRKKIQTVVKNIESIDNKLMSQIYSIFIPIQNIFIKIKDIFARSVATIVTNIYVILASYLGIKSFIGVFVDFMIKGLIILVSIIVPLLMFVFTAPLAAVPLSVFAIVAGYIAVIIANLNDIVDMTNASVPPKPMCFDENTKIKIYNGKYIPIKFVKPNDILFNGSIVTSIMKLSRNYMPMYKYNNIIVSGNHNIKIHNNWIPIEKAHGSVLIENYDNQYLYCINTSTKYININDIIFADWDDIDEMDLLTLQLHLNNYLSTNITMNTIHKELEYGFSPDTIVELEDGEIISISQLEIHDILRQGEKILGLVKISTKNIPIHKYNINNKEFIGSKNLIIHDEDEGLFSTLLTKDYVYLHNKPDYLYNVITDKGTIFINGIRFKDYNGGIETFLDLD